MKKKENIFYVPDLDKSIDALNNMLDTGSNDQCLSEDKKEKKTFEYYGNVYRFGNIIDRNVRKYTQAVSKQEAINNIKFKLKDDMGFSKDALITIDDELVTELPSMNNDETELDSSDYNFDEHDDEGEYNSVITGKTYK